MSSAPNRKTWLEIKKSALKHNLKTIRALLAPKTKLYAVVKSNAYGHGLILFSKFLDKLGAGPSRDNLRQDFSGARSPAGEISGKVDGFCVDSVVEGLKLRKNGIQKPILVLGPTLSNVLLKAKQNNITVTVSSFYALKKMVKLQKRPNFHLKIDTGMHRQGFYNEDISELVKILKRENLWKNFKGIYTHFAAANNRKKSKFTNSQLNQFKKIIKIFEQAKFSVKSVSASAGKNFETHAAATGGTLLGKEYHLDAVRIGMGLYGLWPSEELKREFKNKISLKPVLSWKSIISEIKNADKGERIGYGLAEKFTHATKIAIIPIGYWHGISRNLSSKGELLINNKKARILGKVSMDLIAVDVTGINCKEGDTATLIGNAITVEEIASKTGTINYEVVTRINPLIARNLIE